MYHMIWTFMMAAVLALHRQNVHLCVHNWPPGVNVDAIVSDAIKVWDLPGIETMVVYGGMLEPNNTLDPDIYDDVNVIYIDYWDENFTGKTLRRMDGYQMKEFDIFIERNGLDAFILQKTIMHELGHIYGLEHNHRLDSVMFPGLTAQHTVSGRLNNAGSRVLTQDDVTNLYLRHIERDHARSPYLLEILDLIRPFIYKNVGQFVIFPMVDNQTNS